MPEELLSAQEAVASAPSTPELDEITRRVTEAFSDPHGPAYLAAVRSLRGVSQHALWVIELVIEAEQYANLRPLPMPAGLRRRR